MAGVIEVSGLTKYYGKKRGVIDLSFEVRNGEVFGFLGPNGAGKTTTIRLLMALLFPGSGRASVCGLDCWRESVQVKRLVGYLPGELSLDPNLTGGQILTYFANLRGGVDREYVAALVVAPRPRHEPALPALLARQQAEGGTHPGFHAPAARADPGRADQRAGSAESARVPADDLRGASRRTHRLPVLTRAVGSGVHLRSGGDHP